MFYKDEIENSKTIDVATMRFFNVETGVTNLNSKKYIHVIDAKLFAIEKVIELCAKKHIQSK